MQRSTFRIRCKIVAVRVRRHGRHVVNVLTLRRNLVIRSDVVGNLRRVGGRIRRWHERQVNLGAGLRCARAQSSACEPVLVVQPSRGALRSLPDAAFLQGSVLTTAPASTYGTGARDGEPRSRNASTLPTRQSRWRCK